MTESPPKMPLLGYYVVWIFALQLMKLSFLTEWPGVQKGHFHITTDILSELFRCSTRGATPCNNSILDPIYSVVGWVSTS